MLFKYGYLLEGSKGLGEGRGGDDPIETIRDPRGGRARHTGSVKIESSSTTATCLVRWRLTYRYLLNSKRCSNIGLII